MIRIGRVTPSFLIIGVQKGGTTALNEYLGQHPNLIAPEEKELHFFDTQNQISFKDYRKKFPVHFFSNKMSFESTPRYIYYPTAAKRIYEFNPKMKLIVLLRDPAKRAFSAWNMYKQMSKNEYQKGMAKQHQAKNSLDRNYEHLFSKEFPSFEQWIDFELSSDFPKQIIEPSIIRRGYYKTQIEHYLKYFPRNQILFIDSQHMKINTMHTLNRVAVFLNISDFTNLDIDLSPYHQRPYDTTLKIDVYSSLIDHFKRVNNGLEALTGLQFEWMR